MRRAHKVVRFGPVYNFQYFVRLPHRIGIVFAVVTNKVPGPGGARWEAAECDHVLMA